MNLTLKIGAYHLDYAVLSASDFGVPQARKRFILIGCKTHKIDIANSIKEVKDLMLKKNCNRFNKVTLQDAISDLNFLNSSEGSFEQDYISTPLSPYQKDRRAKSNILYNHIATSHSKVAISRIQKLKPGDTRESLNEDIKSVHSGAYARLSWNDISPTITTRFDTPSAGKVIHPSLDRALTPREAARIQSFDDDYVFYGSKSSTCTQIGNAVPPLMAEVLGNIIKYDKGEDI